MAGVQFGELAVSPRREPCSLVRCVVGLENGKISVYSPSGSGSNDQAVRLWDAQSGALGYTLEGQISLKPYQERDCRLVYNDMH